jgi:rhodanese-related sulfurtransferase
VIDPSELDAILASSEPPRVLDVRTSGEFDAAHITGAHNVPATRAGEVLREVATASRGCDARSIVAQLSGAQ